LKLCISLRPLAIFEKYYAQQQIYIAVIMSYKLLQVAKIAIHPLSNLALTGNEPEAFIAK